MHRHSRGGTDAARGAQTQQGGHRHSKGGTAHERGATITWDICGVLRACLFLTLMPSSPLFLGLAPGTGAEGVAILARLHDRPLLSLHLPPSSTAAKFHIYAFMPRKQCASMSHRATWAAFPAPTLGSGTGLLLWTPSFLGISELPATALKLLLWSPMQGVPFSP